MAKNIVFKLPPDRQAALERIADYNGLPVGSVASIIVSAWLHGRSAGLRKPKPGPKPGQGVQQRPPSADRVSPAP